MPLFIYYYLKNIRNKILNIGKGVAQKNINLSVLKNIEIPMPDLNTQSKIATILDSLSDLISSKEKELGSLCALVKSRFIEMFGEDYLKSKIKIGDVISNLQYGTSKPGKTSGKYLYLRMNNLLEDGSLNLNNLKYIDLDDKNYRKYSIKKGDILFNRTNSREHVGKTCLVNESIEGVFAGYIIRLRLKDNLNPIFFAYYMNTATMKKHLKSIARGAVNQANINSKELCSIPVIIPSLVLQNQFADFVKLIDKSKFILQKEINDLQELLNSKMDEYFGEEDRQ